MRPNYFTCTLRPAASLRIKQLNKTINSRIDVQASEFPNLPAVGVFCPGPNETQPWDNLIFTFSDMLKRVLLTSIRVFSL